VSIKDITHPRSCPLVLIEWNDSRRPIPEWLRLADAGEWTSVVCSSVGWLLYRDQDVVVLAPNIGDLDDDEALQTSGVMQIAARAVTKITRLIEGESIFAWGEPSSASYPEHVEVQPPQ